MADVIRELIESIDEFEKQMHEDLDRIKYDDAVLNYLNLRKKFKNIYDIELKIASVAGDAILTKREETKYYKNSKANEKILKINEENKSQ